VLPPLAILASESKHTDACHAQDHICQFALSPAFGASFADSPIARVRTIYFSMKPYIDFFSFLFEQPPADGTVSPDGRRWRRVHGPFMSVNLAVLSLRNGKSPLGLCPPSHLSSGQGDVVLVDRCGRFSFLRFLLGVAGAGTHMQLPHVQHHPCGEFIFVPDKFVCDFFFSYSCLTVLLQIVAATSELLEH
jgi:hypothetical protein